MAFSFDGNTKGDLLAAGFSEASVKNMIKAFFLYPQFYILFMWRRAKNMHAKGGIGRVMARLIQLRILDLCACEIGITAQIGACLRLPHPAGVVIGEYAVIGDHVTIYQNVTIGQRGKLDEMPVIGNNVTVYAGACILGPAKVGEYAVIGANAVVIDDVPPYAIVGGMPAKIIKYRDQAA